MILAGNCALESMGFKAFGFVAAQNKIMNPDCADIA